MRHIIHILALVLALSAPAFASDSAEKALPNTDGSVRVGDLAPDFNLTTLDGKPLKLSELTQKNATVLIFWSFFCFPCQAEMPELQSLYDTVKDTVSIASVALDGHQYDKFVLPFLAEKKITLPVAYDRETERFFETAEKYGVVGTPTIFLLDEQGKVRFIHLGRLEKPLLLSLIDSIKSKNYCADIIKPETTPEKVSGK